jgi:DNA-directed RNA polymerase alpha subunit
MTSKHPLENPIILELKENVRIAQLALQARKEELGRAVIALTLSLQDIGLSERAIACLSEATRSCDIDKGKVRDLSDLLQRTERELLARPNLGRRTLEEICSTLELLGLNLKKD